MLEAWESPVVRVRCRGEWHETQIAWRGLVTIHSEEELAREAVIAGLGGPAAGCFRAREGWRTGTGWVPKQLRRQRTAFFAAAQAGRVFELKHLFEHGFDARIRGFGG